MADMEQMAGNFQQMGGNGGSGVYQSQVMCMSQVVGEDGKVHVKKYAHSDVGDLSRKQREVKEAYSDSATATDKALHFRQLDNRAHRVFTQRNRDTGHVDTQDEVAGFDRNAIPQFEQDWRTAPALPQPMPIQNPLAAVQDNTNYRPLPPTNNTTYQPGYQQNYQQNYQPQPTIHSNSVLSSSRPLPRREVQNRPYTPGQQTPYVQSCESVDGRQASSASRRR